MLLYLYNHQWDSVYWSTQAALRFYDLEVMDILQFNPKYGGT